MSEEQKTGITKIAVKGFKSIAEECEIDIRPLTILAGANSSGKSSIMQPLLMLKQTLEAPYDPGALLIDGPNIQFTEAAQFLSTLDSEKGTDHFHIGIGIGINDVQLVRMTFGNGKNGFEITKMTIETEDLHLVLYPGRQVEVIKAQGARQYLLEKKHVATKMSRCSLDLRYQNSSTIIAGHEYPSSDIIHLPGLRGNPERTYQRTSIGPGYPGTFEHYTASIIHEWQETKDERLKTVADALRTLELTGHVDTKKVGDVGIEIKVSRFLDDKNDRAEMVNIADVGFGVSQVLPVLVALIVAEPGRLVYIEQPELHLHPRAQVALAQVLADAAKRGVRVVAETHSSLLLLGVQTLVAEGDLPPELVKLHWFSRNKDGITEVDSVDLDEAGAYGDWPMDFDDVELKTQSRYIKAAQSRFIERT